MDLTGTEDIEAPIDQVFTALSDVEGMERQAMRRSIEVRRMTPHTTPEAGMRWNAGFKFRGREMQADVLLANYTPPETLKFEGTAGGLNSAVVVNLTALSPSRTRMNVVAELQPQTLSARLIVQSLKLAKGRVTRKFSVRLSQFAKTLEERARKLG